MNPLDQKKAGTAEDDGGKTKPTDLLSRRSVPKLLKNSAGAESCCIFRIPRRTDESPDNNNKSKDYYEPSVVSIGPYHHGTKRLQMIQEHKQGYLELFMEEARKKDVEMKDLIEAVSLLEENIMDSYSENLDLAEGFDRNKLIDIMVLDGCFILMLFFVATKKVQYTKSDDPIFKMHWIMPAIRKDLLLLENQVPFFLLQTLFDISKIVTSSGLNEITLEFFNSSIERLDKLSSGNREIEPKHLLDLIRMTLVPFKPIKEIQESVSRPFPKSISSAKYLQLRGIRFKTRNMAKTLLEVRFKMGTNIVEIPPVVLDDFLISFFRNCVAFEQFYGDRTNPITSYIAFMGYLIKSEADAKLLTNMRIIENYIGTGEDIVKIFKDIGKDIFFNLHESYLAEVFEGIDGYSAGRYRAYRAYIKLTYFSDPLALQSSMISLMVLLLTLIQVYLGILAYLKIEPKLKK